MNLVIGFISLKTTDVKPKVPILKVQLARISKAGPSLTGGEELCSLRMCISGRSNYSAPAAGCTSPRSADRRASLLPHRNHPLPNSPQHHQHALHRSATKVYCSFLCYH